MGKPGRLLQQRVQERGNGGLVATSTETGMGWRYPVNTDSFMTDAITDAHLRTVRYALAKECVCLYVFLTLVCCP